MVRTNYPVKRKKEMNGQRPGTRKCAVNGHHEHWEGYFHSWGNFPKSNMGIEWDRVLTMGIVEDDRGQIFLVEPTKIHFMDGVKCVSPCDMIEKAFDASYDITQKGKKK
jgi:hypothetical protein